MTPTSSRRLTVIKFASRSEEGSTCTLSFLPAARNLGDASRQQENMEALQVAAPAEGEVVEWEEGMEAAGPVPLQALEVSLRAR